MLSAGRAESEDIMRIADTRTEDLILYLCIGYTKETKKAAVTEQKIIKELANRGVVDLEYMTENFKR